MDALLRFFEFLALSLWLGSVVFFSFLNAPVLFHILPPDQAGRVVRALFPRYYLLGIGCGTVLFLTAAARGLLWTWHGMTAPSAALFAFLAALTLYARQSLTPRINASRDAGTSRLAEFQRLHKRSVRLNAAVLLLLLLYLLWMALRGW